MTIGKKYADARARAMLCYGRKGLEMSDAELVEFTYGEVEHYREKVKGQEDYIAKLLREISWYRKKITAMEAKNARVSEFGIPYRHKVDLFDKIEKILAVPSEETKITIHANRCEVPTIDYTVTGNPYGCEEAGTHIE